MSVQAMAAAGWITKYLVVPEFANVMDSLKVNQVSAPFKTSYGWHIMQLVDKKSRR